MQQAEYKYSRYAAWGPERVVSFAELGACWKLTGYEIWRRFFLQSSPWDAVDHVSGPHPGLSVATVSSFKFAVCDQRLVEMCGELLVVHWESVFCRQTPGGVVFIPFALVSALSFAPVERSNYVGWRGGPEHNFYHLQPGFPFQSSRERTSSLHAGRTEGRGDPKVEANI